jgi:hypothetical protein
MCLHKFFFESSNASLSQICQNGNWSRHLQLSLW